MSTDGPPYVRVWFEERGRSEEDVPVTQKLVQLCIVIYINYDQF